MELFQVNQYSLLLLVSLLLSIGLVRKLYTVIHDPLSSIPGPWYSRWTELPLKYFWLTGQRTECVLCPIVRIGPQEVDVSEVASAKVIHRVGSGFPKSRFYQNVTSGSTINVFSTTDPNQHKALRRLLSSPLSDASLKSLEPLIDSRVCLTIQKMKEEAEKRGAADVFKWWLFMATDIIGELSFGDSFCMLEQGKKNQYILDLEGVALFTGLRTTFPSLFSLSIFLPLPLFRQAAVAGQRMRQYAEESIQRYRTSLAADPTLAKSTLFTKLFDAGKEGLSDEQIRAEALGYIVAGSDTTANTLTYLLWSVCGHKEVKQALLKELQGLPEDFHDEHLRALPYLQQVIEETLRLYSAAPAALPRDVPQAGADLAGFQLPGGVTVTTQAYSLHRDHVVFPEPERFDPTRWATPTPEMKHAFMAFGGGSRGTPDLMPLLDTTWRSKFDFKQSV
ncbi:hypothetical protein FALCPG4_014926 [Fusarium falciforme]